MNKKLLLAGSLSMMLRYRLRTSLMSLGVAVGVATLVTAGSLSAGAEREMLDRVQRMFGPSTLLIAAGGAAASRNGPITTLKIADLEAIEERLDQIVAWDPILAAGGRDVRHGSTTRRVTIFGHSERAERVSNRGVVQGRFFTAADLASAARVTLIGTNMAEALFGGEDPVGRQILVDSVPFRVLGVLEPMGVDPHGMDRDEDVHVPTTTLMRRLLNIDYITNAKLVVTDPGIVEETADEITEILRQRHGIAEGEAADFAIFTPKFVKRMVGRANRVLRVFLPLAGGVVLLLATIVISSIMLMAVRERTAEVGLRKAVGATEGQIGFQFLLEAVGVAAASGLLGLALGAAIVGVVGARMGLSAGLALESVALGMAAALLVGIVSGFLPARRAARLDPVAALQ